LTLIEPQEFTLNRHAIEMPKEFIDFKIRLPILIICRH
jgi:hypothetical protein